MAMKHHGGRASMSTPCRSRASFGDARGRQRIPERNLKCQPPRQLKRIGRCDFSQEAVRREARFVTRFVFGRRMNSWR
jgi:hypothetical protein